MTLVKKKKKHAYKVQTKRLGIKSICEYSKQQQKVNPATKLAVFLLSFLGVYP